MVWPLNTSSLILFYFVPWLQRSSVIGRFSPKVVQLDLTDSSTVAEKCREAISLFGRVDILINNAGISSRGSVLDSSIEVDRRVMEVNFFGTVTVTKSELIPLSVCMPFMYCTQVYCRTCWSKEVDTL